MKSIKKIPQMPRSNKSIKCTVSLLGSRNILHDKRDSTMIAVTAINKSNG
jgi:hypothetical protein